MTDGQNTLRAADQESEWVPVPPSVQFKFQLGQTPAVQRRQDLIARCYELRGPLEVERLREALRRVWVAHDALRLRFALRDGIGSMASVRASERVPLRLQQPVNLAEQDVPRAITTLGGRLAERWQQDGAASAQWLLLRLGPEHHILAGWYARTATDLKGITVLERQIWESYFSPSATVEGSSFVAAARSRAAARERDPRGYWEAELARVPQRQWHPSAVTAVRTVSRDLVDGPLDALRGSAADVGLSMAQLLAHRFAVCAYEVNGREPAVVQHFLDDRTAAEQGAVGEFVLTLPVVVGAEEVSSARASARAAMRAFTLRPRRAGARVPDGLVGFSAVTRPFSFNYVPAHYGRAVEPVGGLTVTEYELGQSIRHMSHLDLRVTETREGGVHLRLTYHPNEQDDRAAGRLLDRLLDASD